METNKYSRDKTINITNENENSNNINNNQITEQSSVVQTSKSQDQTQQKEGKKSNTKKEVDGDNLVVPMRSLRRSNSINMYKKQQKAKNKKDSLKKRSLKEINEVSIVNCVLENNGEKKASKPSKKKVVFLPNFLTVIDVESYKKFNEENTCKDPFDDMEFINGQLKLKIKDDDSDGKARAVCSCYIF